MVIWDENLSRSAVSKIVRLGCLAPRSTSRLKSLKSLFFLILMLSENFARFSLPYLHAYIALLHHLLGFLQIYILSIMFANHVLVDKIELFAIILSWNDNFLVICCAHCLSKCLSSVTLMNPSLESLKFSAVSS